MTYGFETRAQNGTVVLSISDRVSRVLGRVNTTKADGFIEHADFAQGEPFWALLGPVSTASQYQPTITVSTVNGLKRISWAWAVPGSNANNNADVIYGVY